MITPMRAKFDYCVLKPIWVAFLMGGIYCLYHGYWLMVLQYVISMFVVGYIGASLYRAQTFSEARYCSATSGASASSQSFSIEAVIGNDDTYAVTIAGFRIAAILAIVAGVAVFESHGWLFSVVASLAIWRLGGALMLTIFMLIIREHIAGRLRYVNSIYVDLFLFWFVIYLFFISITFAIRMVLP